MPHSLRIPASPPATTLRQPRHLGQRLDLLSVARDGIEPQVVGTRRHQRFQLLAHLLARGLVGDVRAAERCLTLLSVCNPVCNRFPQLSSPPFPRPSPQGTP